MRKIVTFVKANPMFVLVALLVVVWVGVRIMASIGQVINDRERKAYERGQQELIEKANQKDKEANEAKSVADTLRKEQEGLNNEIADKQKQLAQAWSAYESAKRRAALAGQVVPDRAVDTSSLSDPGVAHLCARAESIGSPCIKRAD